MSSIPFGAIVATPRCHGPIEYWHVGWVSRYGLVVSNGPRTGVEQETIADFSQRRPVILVGALQAPSLSRVEQNVFSENFQRSYSWNAWNCEHWLFAVHGLRPQSPQVSRAYESAAFGALVGGGLALLFGAKPGAAIAVAATGATIQQVNRVADLAGLYAQCGIQVVPALAFA